MIITIAHTKGGVGKSTLAWHLAHALVQDERKVTIVDLDFQQTLFFISSLDENNIIEVKQPQTGEELIELFENYKDDEYVIVDVGGFDNDLNRLAISKSHKVVVPISNSVTEVLGFKTFEAILEELGSPFIYVVLNNIHPLTKNFDLITQAIGKKSNIRLQNSIIRNRNVYKKVMGFGKSVFGTKDTEAQNEIRRLKDELISD